MQLLLNDYIAYWCRAETVTQSHARAAGLCLRTVSWREKGNSSHHLHSLSAPHCSPNMAGQVTDLRPTKVQVYKTMGKSFLKSQEVLSNGTSTLLIYFECIVIAKSAIPGWQGQTWSFHMEENVDLDYSSLIHMIVRIKVTRGVGQWQVQWQRHSDSVICKYLYEPVPNRNS